MRASVFSRACRRHSRWSATTRSPSTARTFRIAWSSPPGPTTARSWAYGIASSTSRACSSIPSPSRRSMGTPCCAGSSSEPCRAPLSPPERPRQTRSTRQTRTRAMSTRTPATSPAVPKAPIQITPQEALVRCIEHREIFHDEMLSLMRRIMSGEVSPVMTAAILAGLRIKKETIGEITAAASVMREFARRVEFDGGPHFVDIVGTGGDGAHTFNISTAATFVAAAAGATVAKHGNRGVSSKSGAADVLEALGGNIMLEPEQVAESLRATGVGFMFAPNHHPAMKNVAAVRREMGVRTIFNILGPLTNPAGAPNILMGVFHPDLVGIQVRVMQRLGARHALVVYGKDGMDEVSLGAATLVGELRDGVITEYEIHPEDLDR